MDHEQTTACESRGRASGDDGAMRFVTINGRAVHCDLDGPEDAPVLVFSNSLGTDLRVWDGLAGALGARFRLLRYDLRGHGLSDGSAGPYAMADLVEDLSALLDRLGIAEAIVCGLSVGGMIAQGLSAARPELVKGLVLCDTAHRIGPPEMWETRMAAIREGGIAAVADAILERWFSPAFRAGRPEELAGWRNMLLRIPVEGYLGTCAAIRDADQSAAARAISVPTLCLGGSEDGATPPDLVRSLADLVPGARFELIEGAGHLPCVERPDILAALITGFLEETGLA